MKIKKEYTFTNKRQIWRIIPTDTGKLIIEEREPETKQVFYNCIDIKTGKKFFKNLQFEEKFWIGIEAIYNDVIYFHKYHKPDMPGHIGITAFDINSEKILWAAENYSFLFAHQDDIYCYTQNFEGRNFYLLDAGTGELKKELSDDPGKVNFYRKQANNNINFLNISFPKQFNPGTEVNERINNLFNNLKSEYLTSGKIEYIESGNLLLFNFHYVASSGNELKNLFKAVDIDSGKVIFEEELNSGIKAFVPDSFFIRDDFIFLLKGKNKLLVCSINR
jgi:hypothetical protein